MAKSAVAEQISTPSTARWKPISFLALRIAFALLLLAAGGAKLAGNAQMVQLFDTIGIGQWFRIFTGICELLTAILLLFPATIGIGALLGFGVMVGATIANISFCTMTSSIPRYQRSSWRSSPGHIAASS